MFSEVDRHIEEGKLISEFRMSALPSLYAQFVQLIKYLVIFQYSFMQLRVHLVSLSVVSESYPITEIFAVGK